MLCTLLALTLSVIPGGGDDPASLVPADTILYFGTDSIRLGAEASRNSAVHKMLAEPEVNAFLAEPIRSVDFALAQISKEAAESNVPEGVQPALEGKSWGDRLLGKSDEGPPLGKFFLALTHVKLPRLDATGALMEAPDVGLVVGVEMLDDEDVAVLRSLWDWIPFPGEEYVYNGQTCFTKRLPADEFEAGIHLAFVNNLAVISVSEKSLKSVLDRHNPSGKALASLATSTGYQRMLAAAGGQQPGGTTSFLRIPALVELAWQGLVLGLTEEGETELIPKLALVRQKLGLEAWKWSGGTTHRDPDGLVHSTVVVASDEGVQGLLSRCMQSTRAFDMSLLKGVPGDAMGVTGAHLGGSVVELYDFAMDILDSQWPEEAAMVHAQLDEAMGEYDLRDDLLANVHGDLLQFQSPGQGFMGQPATILRVGVKDPKRFVDTVNQLLTAGGGLLEELTDMPAALELKETAHGDIPIYELDLSRVPALAMTMLQPALAIVDGDLVLGVESVEFLKSYLNGEAGTGSITEHAGFMQFVDRLSHEGEVTSVSYTDIAKTVGVAYAQVAGAAQMMAGAASELPVDLALMPSEQAVTKHLGESFAGEYVTRDRELRVYRSESRVVWLDFLPLALPIAGAFLLQGAGMTGEAVAEVVDPVDQARAHINELQAALTIYKITVGDYPAELADLVRPLPDFENGCLGRSELPQDPWGNSYLYRIDGRKGVVWSAGPNGVDEQGEGDDILKKKRKKDWSRG